MNKLLIAPFAAVAILAAGCETPSPVSQQQGSQQSIPQPSGSQSGSQSSSQSGSQSSQQGSAASLPSGGGQQGGGAPSTGGMPNTGGGQGGADSESTQGGQQGGAVADIFGSEDSGGGSSGAEDAFNDSLEDFDDALGGEQEALARAGGGAAADEDIETFGTEVTDIDGGPGDPSASGAPTPEDPRVIAGLLGGPGVEGCEDDDIVARQLCEIATAEEDPFLRADLWEEYNEYRRILAGQ